LFGGFSESILAGIFGSDIVKSFISQDGMTLQDIVREWFFNILDDFNSIEFCNACE